MDYRIKENRVNAIKYINSQFNLSMSKFGFDKNTWFEVTEKTGWINIGNCSTFLDAKYSDLITEKSRRLSTSNYGAINSPKSDSAINMIHAAIVLNNWDAIFEIVEKYCRLYRELREEILKQNNVKT